MKIKAFLTNLADYNNGILNGEWVSFPVTEEEKQEIFDRLNIGSKQGQSEEYFFTDYDGFIFGEFESFDKLNEAAIMLAELDEYDQEKLEAIIEYDGFVTIEQFTDYINDLDDYVFYQDQTLEDVAFELLNEYMESCNVPEFIQNLVDYSKFENDLTFEGYRETNYGVIARC